MAQSRALIDEAKKPFSDQVWRMQNAATLTVRYKGYFLRLERGVGYPVVRVGLEQARPFATLYGGECGFTARTASAGQVLTRQ